MRLVVPGVLYLDLRFAPALDEGYTKVKASPENHTGLLAAIPNDANIRTRRDERNDDNDDDDSIMMMMMMMTMMMMIITMVMTMATISHNGAVFSVAVALVVAAVGGGGGVIGVLVVMATDTRFMTHVCNHGDLASFARRGSDQRDHYSHDDGNH